MRIFLPPIVVTRTQHDDDIGLNLLRHPERSTDREITTPRP